MSDVSDAKRIELMSKPTSSNIPVVVGVVVAVSLAVLGFFFYRYWVNGFFSGDVSVSGNLSVENYAKVAGMLTLPVDKSGTISAPLTGSIEYDTASENLLAYNGTEWKQLSTPSIHAETVESLVTGANTPIIPSVFDASYNGTVRNVGDEASLISALSIAADNDVINFTATITLTATLTVPDRRLKFNLGSFALQGPTSLNTLVSYVSNTKELYFSNGTIRYSSGTTSSIGVLVVGSAGAKLFFIGTTLVYGEFAVSLTNAGDPSLVPRLFMEMCTITYDGAVGGASNSHRAIFINGMSAGSYVYLNTCVVNSVNADDSHRLRFINTAGVTDAGDITITNCNINPANRLQAVVFYEASLPPSRGTHKLMMDKNTVGNAGERNQLCLIFAGGAQTQVLNSFEAIWFVENNVARLDDDKGLLYIDTSFAGSAYEAHAGSADVYVVKNTYPSLAAPGATRRLISKDGFVRGSVGINAAYLQRYRL